jgi:hypothetical protein
MQRIGREGRRWRQEEGKRGEVMMKEKEKKAKILH